MKDKTWTFKALRMILEWYEVYRTVMKYPKDKAIRKTLQTYGDFYEVFTERNLDVAEVG